MILLQEGREAAQDRGNRWRMLKPSITEWLENSFWERREEGVQPVLSTAGHDNRYSDRAQKSNIYWQMHSQEDNLPGQRQRATFKGPSLCFQSNNQVSQRYLGTWGTKRRWAQWRRPHSSLEGWVASKTQHELGASALTVLGRSAAPARAGPWEPQGTSSRGRHAPAPAIRKQAEHIHTGLAVQKSLLREAYKPLKPRGTVLCHHSTVLLRTVAPKVLKQFFSAVFTSPHICQTAWT